MWTMIEKEITNICKLMEKEEERYDVTYGKIVCNVVSRK